MAQRIQASLNAGLCLIISRKGLSVVPQKKETERECCRERERQRAEERLKARGKGSTRSSRRDKDISLWPCCFSLAMAFMCMTKF